MTQTLNRITLASLLFILLLTGCATETSATLTPIATLSPAAKVTATPSSTSSPVLSPTPIPATPTNTPTSSPSTTLTPTSTPIPTTTPTSTPSKNPTPVPASSHVSNAQLLDKIEMLDIVGDTGDITHVVIVSIDGLRPDAWDQADTPILDALRAKGSFTDAAQTVLPAATLIGHASMLGGMVPDKHGIYWNVYDPSLGKINGPTLFSVAHEAGLNTAMVVGKPRLEHIVLPHSVDNYNYAGFTDRQVVNQALPMLQTGLSDILFIHLPDVDTFGHASGWMSTDQLTTISATDTMIGEVVVELAAHGHLESTLLIITTDHGGKGFKHGSALPEDITIPWLAVGPGIPAGLDLQSQVMVYDTAATALYALELPVPPTWDGRPVLEIFGEGSQ
ncbi:alkaline phosphatase family protein [Chloroflexota bacterium]